MNGASQRKLNRITKAGYTLIKNLKNKNADAIDKCGCKNSFGRIILMCIQVNGEQHRIGKQTKGTHRSDEFITVNKLIEEFKKPKR